MSLVRVSFVTAPASGILLMSLINGMLPYAQGKKDDSLEYLQRPQARGGKEVRDRPKRSDREIRGQARRDAHCLQGVTRSPFRKVFKHWQRAEINVLHTCKSKIGPCLQEERASAVWQGLVSRNNLSDSP